MGRVCKVAVLLIAVIFVGCDAAIRGIPVAKQSLYKEGSPFTCFDGSATIPFDAINDDYCDCADGSDEPGTAACGNGHYYCENIGHIGQYILSSRVNDGICDCCDGSDEHAGVTTCENTCSAEAEEHRAANEASLRVQKAGYALRQQWIQEGITKKLERETKKTELEAKLPALEADVSEKQAAKTAAEEPEKTAKDAFDELWKTTLEERKLASSESLFKFIDADEDQKLTVAEAKAVTVFDVDNDGTVSDEEAEDVLDIDGDGAINETEAEMDFESFKEHVYEQQINLFEDVSDVLPRPSEEKPEYDENIKTLIAAADHARAESRAADKAKRDLDNEIKKVKDELEVDLGDGSMHMLQNECFELKDNQYTYKMCPFEKVIQNSGRDTRLGAWGKWVEEDGNKYAAMLFENGEKCWNGPARSTKVFLECGDANELVSASEPNRCEYHMKFKTPVACGPPSGVSHDEL